jgi:hypothetical protein
MRVHLLMNNLVHCTQNYVTVVIFFITSPSNEHFNLNNTPLECTLSLPYVSNSIQQIYMHADLVLNICIRIAPFRTYNIAYEHF